MCSEGALGQTDGEVHGERCAEPCTDTRDLERGSRTVFCFSCAPLRSHKQHGREPLFHILGAFALNIVRVSCFVCHLPRYTVVSHCGFICSCLMANKEKHLFQCLSATQFSSLLQCLNSLPCFTGLSITVVY